MSTEAMHINGAASAASPITLCTTDDRVKWLSMRKLGSSDAAAICGLNPYRSKFQVFLEKLGQAETEENEAMRWGNLLEPIIAQEFANRTGFAIAKDNRLLQHPHYEFMTATLDYRMVDADGKPGILEIKNRNFFAGKDFSEGPGDDAHIQVAHDMAVTGLSYAYVCALFGGNRLVYHRIERDEDLIGKLILLEQSFWELVQTGNPPELSANDNDLVAALFPTAEAAPRSLPAGAATYAQSFLQHKALAKEYEKLADEAAANLKMMLGSSEAAEVGQYRISWKERSRESVNTKALTAAHPDIAKNFLKMTTYRQFDVKELKDNGSKE